MEMIYILVAYDITDTKKRTAIMKKLIYYGLTRIQYSLYEGMVSEATAEEIWRYLSVVDLEETDKIRFIKVCRRCTKGIRYRGPEPESKEHIVI